MIVNTALVDITDENVAISIANLNFVFTQVIQCTLSHIYICDVCTVLTKKFIYSISYVLGPISIRHLRFSV